MKVLNLSLLLLVTIGLSGSSTHYDIRAATVHSLNADVCDLVGYTCVDCSNVVGDFEGADYDKPVALDNGMIFTFNEYNYTYSYRPEVAVFARKTTYQARTYYSYKLWIEDELYDASRVR